MFSFRKYYVTLVRAFSTMASFETLKFDNLALKSLPIDPVKENTIRQVPGACFSLVNPAPVDNPKMVAYSPSAMALLDLYGHEMKRPDAAEYFSGNKLLPGSQTAAHCYCGHQFGYFSGQLGDGAAMYLGEVINEKNERWEIQLKGAGPTPYSRHSDGRKVLRSTIREFLCSEAMHHLGIGSTRAGTCVTSDTTVVRDIFYSGNPINEKCTLVLRIAPTFLRFGSFEIFKPLSAETGRKGPSVGNEELLRQMLDYAIKTFYTEIWDKYSEDKEQMYFEFWSEVVRRTARLVADWQSVGFCHGVLNTDNMSIMGLTIDYGPYGFMDRYQADFVCNNSDDNGRYAYQKQPEICKWNCKKFAEAIQMALPLARTEPELQRIFDGAYQPHYNTKMRRKFGLLRKELPEDEKLFESFLNLMEETGADFTNSFRVLSRIPLPSSHDFESELEAVKIYLVSQCCTAEELKRAHRPQMDPRQLQMFVQLMQTNPGILPALGSRFTAIAQELDRLEKLQELENVTDITKRTKDKESWDKWLNMYIDRLRKEEEGVTNFHAASKERVKVMNETNPRFILRNYIAQNAIKAAEKGDYSEVQNVLRVLENPYSDSVDVNDIRVPDVSHTTTVKDEDAGASGRVKSEASCSTKRYTDITYDSKPPEWSIDLRVT
ncbi:protein adenylyltransferase SelO, mitochondrial-like [Ruditapes philippinarum]|uniref:protein adenylyltransferase SelO, mitochondrial-like n=1 Tax=Ruditapes philippinarum TaxID=129788 RepID=UPI00295AA183|nr:protein adenylyltransferase SelO, mitochondrial-like [Ruditapes philippinarum]